MFLNMTLIAVTFKCAERDITRVGLFRTSQ